MLKQATLKSLIQFHLVIVCSTNHLNHGANTENSEKPEFENCLLLQGVISGEDPYLNNAMNQLFVVSLTKLGLFE